MKTLNTLSRSCF